MKSAQDKQAEQEAQQQSPEFQMQMQQMQLAIEQLQFENQKLQAESGKINAQTQTELSELPETEANVRKLHAEANQTEIENANPQTYLGPSRNSPNS